MISVDEALDLVLSYLPAMQTEEILFQSALGRVLARDLAATQNIPPFDRAAMDGYALRAEDTIHAPVELEYSGTIRAGGGDPGSIGSGQAKGIMTGAPVPAGADAVQIVELCRRTDDGRRVAIQKAAAPGENISPRGSEANLGETVLESGRCIGPAEIAVLASFGYTRVTVWKRPTVGLFSTGDELVEASEAPRPDQIRNSNACSLLAQLQLLGLDAEYLGIARDDKKDLHRMLARGLEHDVVILTGGVSMGEYDLARDVFLDSGLEIIFSRVAMRPGKPTVFARRGNKLVFGLPGNPVSTFVAFESLVRPALGRLCGHRKPDLPRIRGELLRDLKQTPGRTSFLPSWVFLADGQWKVEPLRWKGSADIIAFSRANAVVILPAECSFVAKGEDVEALLFPDHLLRSKWPHF